MASFTNDQNNAKSRHRSHFDRHDAEEAANSSGSFMRQVRQREIPEGATVHNVPNSRYPSFSTSFVRNPESEEITQRRIDEASTRANVNWTLARGAVHGTAALRNAGMAREESRSPSSWTNPVGMLGEAFGARRALSPRSREARRTATEAAEAKRSASLFSTVTRRTN